MIDSLRSLPLTGTIPLVIAWALLLIPFAIIIAFVPSEKRKRSLTVGAIIAAIITGLCVGATIWLGGTPPEQLHPTVYVSIFIGIMAIYLTVRLFTIRAFRWRNLLAIISMLFTIAGGTLISNQAYNYYPDVDSIVPTSHYDEMQATDIPDPKNEPAAVDVDKFNELRNSGNAAPQGIRAKGVRTSMAIPTTKSQFHARNAEVYLPPAWFANPRPKLPVITLLNGTPGSPSQWFEEGGVAKVVDEFQRNHGGISPIVASIDATGDVAANPLCTDSSHGNVMTYMTQDVPTWLKDRLGADPDQKKWTIGGFSYGGTCSFQVATNSPSSYGNFLDYSGELLPNDGESHQTTVETFFNGDEAAFKKRSPLDILNRAISTNKKDFHGMTGRFVAGDNELSAQKDLSTLNDQARKAGMETSFRIVPGGHDFGVWRRALAEDFAFAAQRGGL